MSFEPQQPARHGRVSAALIALFAGLSLFPSPVYAHGMNIAEIAPPVITAGILAFVCYWLVVLWPASKGVETDGRGSPETGPIIRIKRKPRLRVIETNPQFPDGQPETRRAADG